MPDDSVTAALDGIRERVKIVRRAGQSRAAGAPYALDLARRHSAADVPRLVAAADAVLALHRSMPGSILVAKCAECAYKWPCPTVEAVSAALLGGG